MAKQTMSIFVNPVSANNEPYVLPSNNTELEPFIEKYKIDLMEQVVSSIEFALEHKLPLVELFQFKNSKFAVTIAPHEFEPNLELIYNYYLSMEKYELCKRVVVLRDKIKKHNQ
jgi:hypothetical protein